MNYLVCGYLGYGNLGDELTALAVSSSLFRHQSTNKVTFLARKGSEYEELVTKDRSCVKTVVKSIRECDVFILGGGTLITQSSSKRSCLYYTQLLRLAVRMGKKCIVWANGIDPISSSFIRRLLKPPLSKALISVRDTASLDALNRIDPKIRATLSADPVFDLIDRAYASKQKKGSARHTVTICPKKGFPADLGVLIGEFCRRNGLTPVFAALSPEDMDLCIKQASLCEAKAVSVKADVEALSLFEQSLVCVSMRYHGIVCAASLGCVPVAILCENKIRALMSELLLEELLVPTPNACAVIDGVLSSCLDNCDKYRNICLDATKKMLRRVKRAEAFILRDL